MKHPVLSAFSSLCVPQDCTQCGFVTQSTVRHCLALTLASENILQTRAMQVIAKCAVGSFEVLYFGFLNLELGEFDSLQTSLRNLSHQSE